MKKRVVVAGWGQVVQHKEQTDIQDPLGLMVQASRLAGETTGTLKTLHRLDGIMIVRPLSKHYDSAAEQLADEIKATPRFKVVSKIGGNSPQSLINKAAGMIARGELETVLITGAETYYPRVRKKTRNSVIFQGLPKSYRGDDTIGFTESEIRHGVVLPIHGFPLYETALWAESGLALTPYRMQIGERWSGFSKIAAKHPNSWTKTPRSTEEIVTPTRANRYIAFPYTKFMTPLITADLGAAIILMSEEKAGPILQKGKRTVYFLGGGYAEDRQRFLIEKSDFVSSPPLKSAAHKALDRAQLSLNDIQCFDFYSCFPCAVTVACRMLEIEADDPRPLTLTGGLGFFGGPGNNYSLHAVATLADAISEGSRDNGMITSLGWFMHKQAVGIYSAFPVENDLEYHDLADEKNYVAGGKPVKNTDKTSGKGVVETYTVVHDNDGTPSYAVIYGKTDRGIRFISRTRPDPDTFTALTTENQVGKSVRLRFDSKTNHNVADLI